jgi:hypothetical protein
MRWIQPIVGQAIVEDTLTTHRNGRDLDHAARGQWIMGRVIVELTRHRLPADRLTDEENQRIILIAQQAVQKFGRDLLDTPAHIRRTHV